ncbi:MAG: transcription-repair coupling factor [Thermodesulfovibrionales bacterium]|nr:transcription-repair coupling factor [Thermodesulfovibrionales bacterium]
MPEFNNPLSRHALLLLEKLRQSPNRKIFNLSIPHEALILSAYEKDFIAIEDSSEVAYRLYKDCLFFLNIFNKAVEKSLIYLPPPNSKNHIGLRAKAFYNLSLNRSKRMITSYEALKTGFHLNAIGEKILLLKKGSSIERERLFRILENLGYTEVNLVVEGGEYAQRGWLFDIYPVTEDLPIRVEFFGDEIEVLKVFDPNTQRSIREIDEVLLFPAAEESTDNNIIQELMASDIEIFCESSVTKEILKDLDLNNKIVSISHLPFIAEGVDSGELPLNGLSLLRAERNSLEEIIEPLRQLEKLIIIVLASDLQVQRVKEVFLEKNFIIPFFESSSLFRIDGKRYLTIGSLSAGFHLDQILVLTDKEIFGERIEYKPLKKSRLSNLFTLIDELNGGDFVVHDDHGIGKFIKLQRQLIEGYESDLVVIEYEGGDKLYTPIENLYKIKKFIASEGYTPTLDKLGSKRWQRTKQKVKEGLKEMAEKLLHLYAKRKISKGFVFSEDTPLHREFDEFFLYEETEDQIKAFDLIKSRMTTDQPMDFLLCGDVGFGKTEVAMKAAFRALYDGKQVAVIVPTTLLAEQHYRTFKARFSPFPVTIDYLSRFRSNREIKECLIALSRGEIDIIIGTHILLKRDIKFRDLGLVIIDEEHRFGVAQKERLREIKSEVDVLTLTATPIPRTLYISLSGIRDIFTIQTPPEERVAVKTFITKFNEKTIKEAIERELRRDGQVFFVHNRIKDIEEIGDFLKRLIPIARIGIAHGKLPEVNIEKTMLNFLDRKIDVLLCTSIIGSGLDIINANTLIVNRADKFGLSDLYQLKGRVGRGSRQAYAYFLIPPEELLTKDAKKRLRALREMSYLGAGFRLALKDLEIRGTGNILGREQSGHIHKIGFDTYLELLEKTIAELKGQPVIKEVDPQIRFKLSAYIPEKYISDISLRLNIYRRLSMSKSIDDLEDLKEELIDRFGSLPPEVLFLFHIMRLKIYATKLYITKIIEGSSKIRFFFITDHQNEYNIPENFFDKILKNLFIFATKNKSIRFYPDGFEINIEGMSSFEAIFLAEKILKWLIEGQNRS